MARKPKKKEKSRIFLSSLRKIAILFFLWQIQDPIFSSPKEIPTSRPVRIISESTGT